MPLSTPKAAQQRCVHSASTPYSHAAARSVNLTCNAHCLCPQLESVPGRSHRRSLLVSCKAERTQQGKGAAVLEAEIPNSREEAVSRSVPLLPN